MKRVIPVVVFVVLLSVTACAGGHGVAEEHSGEHSSRSEQNRQLPFNIRHYGH